MAEEVTIRQYVPGPDDETWVSIYNRARAAAPEFVPDTIEELKRERQRPRYTLDGRFVAELDGVPVGRVRAAFDPDEGLKVGFIDGPEVLPEARRRGIGTALLERALENLRERGATRAEGGAGDWNTGAQAFLRRHGFEPAHTYTRMERDLVPVAGVGENQDVEVVPVVEDDAGIDTLYRLMSSAYAEYHNFAMGTLEEFAWFVRHQRDGGTHIERYFALDRGRPVGYVVVAVDHAENAQLDRKRGEVYTIGVLKEDRCRGIAKRLLAHTVERLRALGMESVLLSVDDQNVTAARRVYERVGFRLVRRYTSFELVL
ncbi:MAG: GNAT family N-acetyltransferase [bacterium]